jgi:cell division protein ZapD
VSNYEFPFNERIRTLLRIEDLFKKVLINIETGQQHNHHSALMSLLQLLDIVERADIKVELVQELDRQRINMHNLRGNPNISEDILNNTIKEIEACSSALRQDNAKVGQALRDNEWLMSIKQRAGIPGGVCQFDLPSYHYWMNLGEDRRKSDFESWLSRLLPVFEAIKTIMHILRGSGVSIKYIAASGFYQQMLGGTKPAQLLKIEVSDSFACFPEVSANKYAINVRFNSLDFVQKPKQSELDIDFKMTLCNL